MKNLIVIPARGGSQRIPRKNIRPFAGLPMIAHSIRAALDSGTAARVIVSTDDAEIAGISRAHGAEVPFTRPAALADAHTGTMEVIQHAVSAMIESGFAPEHVCCLYATAPFVTAERLRDGLATLVESGRSYAFAVTDFGFPIQRALRLTTDGGVEPFQPEHRFTRSQDLEPAWHDAGQFYWGRCSAWQAGELMYSSAATPIRIPRHLVQDIDTAEDWERAEWLYRAWQSRNGDQP